MNLVEVSLAWSNAKPCAAGVFESVNDLNGKAPHTSRAEPHQPSPCDYPGMARLGHSAYRTPDLASDFRLPTARAFRVRLVNTSDMDGDHQ